MICPVCEHQQEFGFECEVCGKDLGGLDGLGPPPVAPERVEGFEVTLQPAVDEVPVGPLSDLENTRMEAAEVSVSPMNDMETTAAAKMEVSVERMEDMTDDRAPDDGVRTEVPRGAVTCRYCRNVQALGGVCERCGMAIPRVPVPVAAATKKVLAVTVRCKACGAPGLAGTRCKECGKELPVVTS